MVDDALKNLEPAHALGITTEQHVTFDPNPKGGTRINVTFEFAGTSRELQDSVYQTIAMIAKNVFDSLVAACQ